MKMILCHARVRQLAIVFVGLGIGYFLWARFLADVLLHNYDEGMYIVAARYIHDGLVPLRDFYEHNVPFYVYTLAGMLVLEDSHIGARMLSFAAIFGTACVLAIWVRAVCGQVAAYGILLLYLFVPYQWMAGWAMPNALSILFTTMGMYLLWRTRAIWLIVLSALLITVAASYKATELSSAVAATLFLLCFSARRPLVVPFVVVGLASAGGIVWGFDLITDGAMVTTIQQQLSRATPETWNFLLNRPAYRFMAAELGAWSPLSWNVLLHVRAFLGVDPVSLFVPGGVFCATAMFGAVTLWRSGWRDFVVVNVAWLCVAILFNVFIWFPVFDHYMLQYFPPLMLLSAGAVLKLSIRAQKGALIALLLGTVGFIAASSHELNKGLTYSQQGDAIESRLVAYRNELVHRGGAPSALSADDLSLLTFDPFYNVISDVPLGCELYSPLDQLGSNTFTGHAKPAGSVATHNVSEQEVIDCALNNLLVFVAVSEVPVNDDEAIYLAATPEVLRSLKQRPAWSLAKLHPRQEVLPWRSDQ